MGCTKIGHKHVWQTSGDLTIARCEIRCNFCVGPAGQKDWKYAWFLRRHVRSVHVTRGPYKDLNVVNSWNDEAPRVNTGKAKKRHSSHSECDEDSGDENDADDSGTPNDGEADIPKYVAQPLYDDIQNPYPGNTAFSGTGNLYDPLGGKSYHINHPLQLADEAVGEAGIGGNELRDSMVTFWLRAPSEGASPLIGGAPHEMPPADTYLGVIDPALTAPKSAQGNTALLPAAGSSAMAQSRPALHDGLPVTVNNGNHNSSNGSSFNRFYMPEGTTSFPSEYPSTDPESSGTQGPPELAGADAHMLGLLDYTTGELMTQGVNPQNLSNCLQLFSHSIRPRTHAHHVPSPAGVATGGYSGSARFDPMGVHPVSPSISATTDVSELDIPLASIRPRFVSNTTTVKNNRNNNNAGGIGGHFVGEVDASDEMQLN